MTSGNFKTSYEKDGAIFQTYFVKIWLAVFLVFLFIIPFLVDPYFVSLLNFCGIAVIGALGLNILTGSTGLISLAQATFIAFGAYSTAILSVRVGLPFWIVMPASGIITAVAGLIIGIPTLKLKGLYFAVATMGFAFIVSHIIENYQSLTGGTDGMEVGAISIGTFEVSSDIQFYFLILIIAIGSTLFTRNLFRTRVGRAFTAIRDRDIAAEIIGIDLTKYKLISFMISSFLTGIAGSLYAYYMRFIGPDHFTLSVSIQYLAMIIIGGMGTVLGSIYGAVFMTLIPEVLRLLVDVMSATLPMLKTRFVDLKDIVYGFIIVGFLLFEPDGFYGRWITIKTYWKMWPYTY